MKTVQIRSDSFNSFLWLFVDNNLNDLICQLGEEKQVPVTSSKIQDDTISQLPEFHEETIEQEISVESNHLNASDCQEERSNEKLHFRRNSGCHFDLLLLAKNV